MIDPETGIPVEESTDFAAVPDAFQRLWTPHRLVYIQEGQQPEEHACPFCLAPSRTDEEALIVARGEHAYVLLNLFPYNPGHSRVVPYRKVADLEDLDLGERRFDIVFAVRVGLFHHDPGSLSAAFVQERLRRATRLPPEARYPRGGWQALVDLLDRLLGAVLSYSDDSFNTILELGFASSIRKEWEWRESRGESTRNLEAFKHLKP